VYSTRIREPDAWPSHMGEGRLRGKDSDEGFRLSYGQMGPFLGAPNGGLECEGEKRASINQVRGAPPSLPRARDGGALLLQLQQQLLLQCY
jgi:hypothetical protein